jgi:hypothetical protein
MRRWFRIASITILPVVVVAFIFLTERRTSPGEDSVFEVVGLGLLNALTFALPQFAWLAARGLFHFTSRVCDAGLVAADLMLLVFAVVVVFQTDPFAGRLALAHFGRLPLSQAFLRGLLREYRLRKV